MEKTNTKKYVYVVTITWIDSFGGLANITRASESESKAREVYMEERKSILQDWEIENIDLNAITNEFYIKENNSYLYDYKNKMDIKDTTGKTNNQVQLKFIKIELE